MPDGLRGAQWYVESMRRLLCFLAVVVTCVAQTPKRPITDKDLFAFTWIGDTQLSPAGTAVCFVQATVTPDHSGYQTTLLLLDLSKPDASPVQLIAGTHDGSPRWSPDGTKIAFVRAPEKDGKPAPAQLYVMDAKPGASAIRLTDMPKGVSAPRWSPNGAVLSVVSLTPHDPEKAKLAAAVKGRATGDAAHESDVRIINRANYRSNGEGYLDPTLVPQVYMVHLPKADGTQQGPEQLTGGRFGVQDYLWSPDSGWLFWTSIRVDEPVYEEFPHSVLQAIVPKTAASTPNAMPAVQFTQDLGMQVSGLSISPDGNHLAFHAAASSPHPISHAEEDLWVVDLAWSAGQPAAPRPARNLTEFKAFEMGSGVGGDNTAPRGGGRTEIAWSADNSHLLDVAGSRGSALLLSVDAASGEVTQLSARQQAVLSFAATPDQKTIVALVSTPIRIGDLFRIDPAVEPGGPMPGSQPTNPAGNQTQLTHVNDDLFSQLDLALPQELKVTPTAHPNDIPYVTIDTFVQLPPGMDPASKPKLPAILNIHGGPHSAYGWVFDHEMLLMAARGYVIVYPNPRGSTTYGQNFATIIENNYPGDDFHDLMDTVDAVVANGWADPARFGVTGGSGGGLLTDWVVTQTNRFKAAVAQRDITDWAGWWYTADMSGFHQSFYPKSPPFDNVELYRKHSPLTFVNNIKTPMMFILGDADLRTPPTSGGEEFFRALKFKKIPTVMVRFPRESHELSRSGEPWHRVERLDNIIDWFDEFLLGKCEPQYQIAPTCTK